MMEVVVKEPKKVIKKKAREKDEEVSYVKSTYSEDIFP